MSEQKLLTMREVLERLRMSRSSLYNFINKGKIKPVEKPPYLKKTGRVQFTEEEVERFLKEETQDRAAVA